MDAVTFVPTLSEATARRQVSAARAVRTRFENEIRDFGWTDARQDRVDLAERKLAAAIQRLDAIRSQEPVRHSGAWAA